MAIDKQYFCFICGQHHPLAEMEALPIADGGHSAPICKRCLPEARRQLAAMREETRKRQNGQ